MKVEFKATKDNEIYLQEITIDDAVSLTVSDGLYQVKDKYGFSYVPTALYTCYVREEE